MYGLTMHKSEKGDNLAKYLQNLQKVNHVTYTLNTISVPNIYRNLPKVNQAIYTLGTILSAKYHDPCSSGSPDILLTRFQRFTSTLVNFLTHWVAYTHILHLIGYSNSHCVAKMSKDF